jgi:hypothetical protein
MEPTMSTQYEASGQTNGPWRRGSCGPFRGWHPVEMLAMVLGFAVWWPIGLAVLGYKMAQKKGIPLPDVVEMARERFNGFARGFRPEERRRWRPFETSGNAAFDEWRKTELEKLEEQRRKLDAAEREFAEHMDNLRRARDKEEFERFMAARGNAAQG